MHTYMYTCINAYIYTYIIHIYMHTGRAQRMEEELTRWVLSEADPDALKAQGREYIHMHVYMYVCMNV